MGEWIDHGALAGMSATMAYWLFVAMVGMGAVTWRYRARFSQWRYLTTRERADAIFSVSLCMFLLHDCLHRTIAAYSFAARDWNPSLLTLIATTPNLAWALLAVAGMLWWVCIEVVGTAQNGRWWLLFILTGVFLGAGVSWRY